MDITIYGASDDLLEIEGDIRDELDVRMSTWYHLFFNDGTVAKIAYTDDGVWRIELDEEGSLLDRFTHTPNQGSDSKNYTDRLRLEFVEPVKFSVTQILRTFG